MKKIITIISVLLLSFSAFAGSIYIGPSFLVDYDYISRDTSELYTTLNTNPDRYVYNIRSLGIGIHALYYPYDPLRLGIALNYKLNIPIGYELNESGGSISTYVNRHFLSRHDINIGIAYDFMIGDTFGAYLEGGAVMAIHSLPTHNDRNSKEENIRTIFNEYGIYIDAGLLLLHNGTSYYKIGATANGILSNANFGFSIAIKVAGGFMFSF